MPKVSQDHLENKRFQILMAAFKCFGRKGFHETSMREICDEADMSPGAVYNYFDGKKAIIRAIAEKSRESARNLFNAVDQSQPAIQVFREVVMGLADHIEHPETTKAHHIRIRLWGEVLKNPEIKKMFLENLDDLTQQFANLIDRAKQAGDINADSNSGDLAYILMAFYLGMVLQKALNPNKETTSAFELFLDLLE